MDSQLVLVLHAAATWFMTGVIWYVQLVHYPLMSRAGAAGFESFEAAHMRRTSWVVVPGMLLEAATAVWLAIVPAATGRGAAGLGLALLAAIWLSTALLQAPAHRRLARGFDARVHARLVRTNWLRTALWSLRALLVAGWL